MKRMQMRLVTGALTITALVLGVVGMRSNAQPSIPNMLSVAVTAPKSAPVGKPLTLVVTLTIESKYHLQGNNAKDPYIPTVVTVGQTKGFKPGKVVYPASVVKEFTGEKLPVYEKKVEIKVPVTPDASLKPGKYTLPITVSYQGCNDRACYPPDKKTTQVSVNVTAK